MERLLALCRALAARQGFLPGPGLEPPIGPRRLPVPKRLAGDQLVNGRPAKAARLTGQQHARSGLAPPPGSLFPAPGQHRGRPRLPEQPQLSLSQGLPLPGQLQLFSDEFEEPQPPPPQQQQQQQPFLPLPPLGPAQPGPHTLLHRPPSPAYSHMPTPELLQPEPFVDAFAAPELRLPLELDLGPPPHRQPRSPLLVPEPRQLEPRRQRSPPAVPRGSDRSPDHQYRGQSRHSHWQGRHGQQEVQQQQPGAPGRGPRFQCPHSATSVLLYDVPLALSPDGLVRLLDGPGRAEGQYDLLRIYPDAKGAPSQTAVLHFKAAGQLAALWARLTHRSWQLLGAPAPDPSARAEPHLWVLGPTSLEQLRGSPQLGDRKACEFQGAPSAHRGLPGNVTCVFYCPQGVPADERRMRGSRPTTSVPATTSVRSSARAGSAPARPDPAGSVPARPAQAAPAVRSKPAAQSGVPAAAANGTKHTPIVFRAQPSPEAPQCPWKGPFPRAQELKRHSSSRLLGRTGRTLHPSSTSLQLASMQRLWLTWPWSVRLMQCWQRALQREGSQSPASCQLAGV